MVPMNRFLILFLLILHSLSAVPALVFVHLGQTVPPYLTTAVAQARLFNPDIPIYVLVNQIVLLRRELSNEVKENAICVAVESLDREPVHDLFKRNYRLARQGFWLFATERFYYLYELMKKYQLTDVFHMENDIMLYVDLKELLPTFQKHYAKMIAATFDNEDRCIGGFMYFPSLEPFEQFLQFATNPAYGSKSDMYLLGLFKNTHRGRYIDHLPITLPAYADDYPLITPNGLSAKENPPYFHHFDEFQSIFDAAAIGQYLGGIDPIHTGSPTVGFVNEACVFNPSYFQYQWVRDEQDRLVPFIVYKNEKYRINNLHIHCKNLKQFYSKKGAE